MTREFSAGGVVVRQMRGRWWLAAIEPAGRSTSGAKTVLALPKGLVDAGEKPEQAAIREVFEETGLKATTIAKLGDTRYVYVRTWGDGERVFKIVSFYLLRYESGRIDDVAPDMRIEVKEALWIDLHDAASKLAYGGEKDMVKKARKYLEEHG